MKRAKPEVANLPERILVVRQQFDEPDTWPPGEYRLSLNFEPAFYPQLPSPVIQMKPRAKEFWRVANASAQEFLALHVLFGNIAQPLMLIALDGVPVRKSVDRRTVELPPGGRAESIVTGPAAGQAARLITEEFETGRKGYENPAQELAKIVTTDLVQVPPAIVGAPVLRAGQRWAPAEPELAGHAASVVRKLYFAEAANGTNGPTHYLLTVEGMTPRVFDKSSVPAIVTKVGAVEDWIVANHSGEVHAFHLHHIHFLLLEVSGKRLPNPELRDTVTMPAWKGAGPFPTVKLRVDLRDPRTAGTFVAQCQIMHHAEAGMMAKIQVNP